MIDWFVTHMAFVGMMMLIVCVSLKVYVLHNVASHPLFRVSPLFTRHGKFVKGQRVRIVRMDGCMAHVRGLVEFGTVDRMSSFIPYGSSDYVPFVLLRMDDGTMQERPAVRPLWTKFEGLMEYRY